ncbi:MAG: fumarate hydratase subunit beta [Clostridia bacterium]|nr:fumarate hydratase subunit beta [Clostridia bacterium]
MIKLTTPISPEEVKKLKVGDQVSISGVIYTARDAAHKRMVEAHSKGEKLPVDLKGQIIYYVGPCPAKPGKVVGAAGPTTSGRMDKYAPTTLDEFGLIGMIGKGQRSPEVVEAIKRNGAVYFVGVGGAGALLATKIKKVECMAYEDLGCEAIYRFEVEDLPVIVGIDSEGNNAYDIALKK